MAEEGYVVDGGTYQLGNEWYVVVNGTYQAVSEAYVVKNGVYERFFVAKNVRSWSETLTTSETRTFSAVVSISRSETASLSESWTRDKTSDGPSSLTASWDSGGCDMDLDWTADTVNSQDIYRCSGDACDPQQDGTNIATVSAGTNHYDDTGPAEDSGDYTYQIVTTAGSSNTDTGTAGLCTN